MSENPKIKAGRDLQAEVDAFASDMSRGEIGEVIEQMKGPRKIINDFVVKHQDFVKSMISTETEEAVNTCGPVVHAEHARLLPLAQGLLVGLENWRWLVDERIAILRRQEALAKDKYGNERKPLELSPEEQELAYDLRGAAMRDSFEQTQAINRELKVTRMLQQARQEVFDMVNQPLSTLSRASMFKLINWYKRQLAKANQRADTAEERLARFENSSANRSSPSTSRVSKQGDGRPKTSSGNASLPVVTVGPADVKHLQEKLLSAHRELDDLRKRIVESERELDATKQKMNGSEQIIERLAKIANRERQRSSQLERELTRFTEYNLSGYTVAHRTYAPPPDLLPTTTGDSLSVRKH